MTLDKKTQRVFDKELKIPCHINYIADRVFKLSKDETMTIIKNMVDMGLIEESPFAKNYFKIKENV